MIAELMPDQFAAQVDQRAAELPGLIEASVWMKSSYPSTDSPLRPSALTMPEGHVWPMPNGLPIAIT